MSATKNGVLLAEGRLSWNRAERVTDRYGAVTIQRAVPEEQERAYAIIANHGEASSEDLTWAISYAAPRSCFDDFADAPVGQRGRLVAEVVAVRESAHVGDLFHGIATSTPEVGERIELGTGELFVEDVGHAMAVGLRPLEALGARQYKGVRIGPDVFWLDPEALYRVIDQDVRLFFEGETAD